MPSAWQWSTRRETSGACAPERVAARCCPSYRQARRSRGAYREGRSVMRHRLQVAGVVSALTLAAAVACSSANKGSGFPEGPDGGGGGGGGGGGMGGGGGSFNSGDGSTQMLGGDSGVTQQMGSCMVTDPNADMDKDGWTPDAGRLQRLRPEREPRRDRRPPPGRRRDAVLGRRGLFGRGGRQRDAVRHGALAHRRRPERRREGHRALRRRRRWPTASTASSPRPVRARRRHRRSRRPVCRSASSPRGGRTCTCRAARTCSPSRAATRAPSGRPARATASRARPTRPATPPTGFPARRPRVPAHAGHRRRRRPRAADPRAHERDRVLVQLQVLLVRVPRLGLRHEGLQRPVHRARERRRRWARTCRRGRPAATSRSTATTTP